MFPAAAPGPQLLYNTSTHSYLLNTKAMNFSAAEAWCQTQGGHLASYNNAEEQAAVERFYVNGGMLYPLYNIAYWIGLKAQAWPRQAALATLVLHGTHLLPRVAAVHASSPCTWARTQTSRP